VKEYSAITGRLGLGLLGLEGDALGSSALLAHGHDNQLFLGLERRRVRAKTARGTLGTAATLWSTALARDVCGRKSLAERQGTSCWRVLARARARLLSVYPLRDRSRSQVIVDEGES
jgi:hypothetical protein